VWLVQGAKWERQAKSRPRPRPSALVLVGGEGTRLRPLTLTQPKPAVPLVDRPFIRYMVDWLARHGVDDVILACGFKADLLRDEIGMDVRVTVARPVATPAVEPSGSGAVTVARAKFR